MGRIGMPELLIILAIVIVIFGANRLPNLGKGIGSAIKNFKDEIGGRRRGRQGQEGSEPQGVIARRASPPLRG